MQVGVHRGSLPLGHTCLIFIIVTQMIVNSLAHRVPTFMGAPLIYAFSIRNRKRTFFNIRDLPPEQKSLVYPKQYPTNLTDSAPMIPRGRPVRFLTPKDEIPEIKMMSNDDAVIKSLYHDDWKSPENAFKLHVGLIGPVNSGKSELLARLSHKVSAVSPKNNTTSDVLHAFKSFETQDDEGIRNIQLKYFDTPGLSRNKTGYLSKGWRVLGDIDFSLLVIDSSKNFDDLLKQSINRLEKHRQYQNFMKALVLNKIDLVQNKRKFNGLISQIQKYGKFDKIFYTSALTGYGVAEIQQYLGGMAKKGDWQYPKQAKTDSSDLEVVEQMLKEALFHRSYNQVPYELTIECESMANKSNGVHFVQFRVMVEDENVQRMIIGKKGQNIDWVREHFKANYAKINGVEVEVHVRVVVRKNRVMRESEEIESSYHEQQKAQEMRFLREELTKTGKMLK